MVWFHRSDHVGILTPSRIAEFRFVRQRLP
jgi:hypothetical protein